MAAIQVGPDQAIGRRSQRILETLICGAASENVRLLCFPEHWIGEETERTVSATVDLMKRLAQQFRITIIPGGFYYKLQDGIYVATPVIDHEGELIGLQKKIHLFGDEKKRAKPASEYTIFNVDNLKFGIIVCYDLVFPEVARTLALKGADVIFVPSRILDLGIKPWHLYLSTRCLENRVPVVAPNVVWPPKYIGHSLILGLEQDATSPIVYPKTLATGGQHPEVIIAEIDPETVRNLREARLSERRPEAYKCLLEKARG
ncbi:MAG: carbon-nitrogen hydrolase family protein [Candidatus Bathyarchaeia archaeon]